MKPFEAVGEVARWRVIYPMLRAAAIGDVLTYEEMGRALALDPVADRGTIISALQRAAKEHEENDKRAVEVVRNVGYRVVEPAEHVRLAKRHQRRAGRQLVRSNSKAVNVDWSKLDPETRKALDMVGQVIAMQMDFNRRVERRFAEHKRAISSVTKEQTRSASEIEELRARLEQLEAHK